MKRKTSNTNQDVEFDVLPIGGLPIQRLYRKEMVSTLYEYYLVGDITEPENYIDLCDLLRHASPNDEIVIRFNSGGGLLSTGDMIINAINESQANVHGFIEHACGSMATMLFLACHNWSVSENAEFFVHSASGGTFGKEHENYASTVFARKKIHKMIKTRYDGFLSEDEINNVLNGQDYYFDADEIKTRLESFSERQQELFQEEMEKLQNNQDGISDISKEDKLLS